MKLTAIAPFSWAHRHVEIKNYAEGDVIETEDEDLIRVSREEGWAVAEGDEAPPKKRSKGVAPENKDAGTTPENQ